MAINKKLIRFATKAKFEEKLDATPISEINDYSIVFIDDTGEIWTHGRYYGGIYGIANAQKVPLTIGGTTWNLSIDGHTHNYLSTSGGTITGSLALSGSITNLDHHGGGIFWNPYAESDADPSDVASISVNTSGGSTIMTIKQLNDANDYVNFAVGASDGVRVNGNTIYHAGNIPTWNQSTTGSSATTYKLWTTSHPNDWALDLTWDGSYFQAKAKQGTSNYLSINVERANNAGYATSAGSATSATNSTSAEYSARLTVIDNRGTDVLPNSYDSNRVTAFFNELTGVGTWASGITVAGWSTGYSRWQLFGYSSVGGDDNLYFRSQTNGSTNTWNTKRTLWHTGNFNPANYSATGHTHNYTDLTNLIVAGNEHNWVPNGYSGDMWINYQDRVNRGSTALIGGYHLGNGRSGYANISTSGYIINGYDNNYVVLAGGGAAAISGLSVSYATTASNSYYQVSTGISNDWVTSFQNTPAHATSFREMSAGGPSGAWWFMQNFRHSNGDSYWGRQIAWGWEDNAHEMYSRNITANSFSGWVRFLNSSNYNSFSPTLTGGGASGTWGINISGNSETATRIAASVSGTNTIELVRGNMADNDVFRILVGGTASNSGYAEIATADDGSEPIYVRQYSGVFTSLVRTATLLNEAGNTIFPGAVTANRFYAGYDSGVANSVSCSDWFRSSGATGWYNATYGGGIYCDDTTWVKVYNNKGIYTAGNLLIGGTGNFNGSQLVLRGNSVESHSTNGVAELAINYYGYNGGYTQYRNLAVYNGKCGINTFFDGVNGRVGIGTNAPTDTLDVRGTGKFTGNITAPSFIGNAATASQLSGSLPLIASATENNPIAVIDDGNGAITVNSPDPGMASIRHGFSFKWYTDDYHLGIIRSGGTDSQGIGITQGSTNLLWNVRSTDMKVYVPTYTQALNVNGELTTTKNIYLNNSSENALYSNGSQISFIKYDSSWVSKSRLTLTDDGILFNTATTSNIVTIYDSGTTFNNVIQANSGISIADNYSISNGTSLLRFNGRFLKFNDGVTSTSTSYDANVITSRTYAQNFDVSTTYYNYIPIVLWHGTIGINSGGSVNISTYHYGQLSPTGTRLGQGSATINLNNRWSNFTSISQYHVICTGVGKDGTDNNGSYGATPLNYKTTTSFRLYIFDDATTNDGKVEVTIMGYTYGSGKMGD